MAPSQQKNCIVYNKFHLNWLKKFMLLYYLSFFAIKLVTLVAELMRALPLKALSTHWCGNKLQNIQIPIPSNLWLWPIESQEKKNILTKIESRLHYQYLSNVTSRFHVNPEFINAGSITRIIIQIVLPENKMLLR